MTNEELNGHIEVATQCCDHLCHEVDVGDDPSGKMQDFADSLRVVLEQLSSTQHRLREREEECEGLKALLNTPRTDEFFESVRIEAAHQRERWGSEHDAGKTAQDWFWLLGYLAGKALGKPEKRLHHIVSSAAELLNWFRAETNEATEMRPGIMPPDAISSTLTPADGGGT